MVDLLEVPLAETLASNSGDTSCACIIGAFCRRIGALSVPISSVRLSNSDVEGFPFKIVGALPFLSSIESAVEVLDSMEYQIQGLST